jgi:hypothetical protein
MEEILSKLEDNGFCINRMIGGSKTLYRRSKPKNLVVFNANIFVDGVGKVWYGDLDLTEDQNSLKNIAIEMNVIFYVLSEMDGRFDKENNSEFKNDYVWNTETGLCEKMKEYYNENLLKI